MKREELTGRLGYQVPRSRKVRVIIDTDLKNEADDHYAVLHHLMTPKVDVCGIIAAHFEGRYTTARKFGWQMPEEEQKAYFIGEGRSMEESWEELQRLLEICELTDIRTAKGCSRALLQEEEDLYSDGVNMIVEECLREDERPLYLVMQGGLTDAAAALNRCPEIAEKMTVIWSGGAPYPDGGIEFNLMQDLHAVRRVMASSVQLWQIPSNVYQKSEVSFAELKLRVWPCGKPGKYLFQELLHTNEYLCQFKDRIRQGENWCLGDSPALGILLWNEERHDFHMEKAPLLRDDMTYMENPQGREIRVYDDIDARFLLEDFFAKLRLCYGNPEDN